MAKAGREKGSIPWNKGIKTGLVPKTAFKKGMKPWNAGKKTGYKPWTTGLKAKDNIKLARILELAHEARRGKPAWNSGTRKPKILKGRPTGENNNNWKGDNVSYRNLHRWIERKLGKAEKCMNNLNHKSRRYHWANISGEYKRDLNDFRQLCPSCNLKERGKLL